MAISDPSDQLGRELSHQVARRWDKRQVQQSREALEFLVIRVDIVDFGLGSIENLGEFEMATFCSKKGIESAIKKWDFMCRLGEGAGSLGKTTARVGIHHIGGSQELQLPCLVC